EPRRGGVGRGRRALRREPRPRPPSAPLVRLRRAPLPRRLAGAARGARALRGALRPPAGVRARGSRGAAALAPDPGHRAHAGGVRGLAARERRGGVRRAATRGAASPRLTRRAPARYPVPGREPRLIAALRDHLRHHARFYGSGLLGVPVFGLVEDLPLSLRLVAAGGGRR